jgi:fatty acid synthase
VLFRSGEVGPYGSSRTRWEAETTGDLTAAGVLELAWSTGVVEWDGSNPERPGWFDTRSGEQVDEADIAAHFRDEVLARVGVRAYHDEAGMDDHTAPLLTSVYLDHDLTFTTSRA